jgi:hypothetical protein
VIVAAVVCLLAATGVVSAAGPLVNWTSPFDQEPGDVVNAGDGTVRLNATVDEPIDYVEVTRQYSDGQTDDRDILKFDDLHNQTVNAGTFGKTEVRVRVFGENSSAPHSTSFDVQVNDNTAPTADLETQSLGDEVRLYGTMTDQTQPERLVVILPDHSNPVVNARGVRGDRRNTGGIEIDHNTVDIETTFPATNESDITVRVKDRAGNSRQIEVPLPGSDQTPTPTPEPTATSNATPEPTLTPVPTVQTPAPTPTPTATEAPSTTSTPAPSGGAGPLTVVFRVLMLGVILFAVGGWISLQ